MKSTVILYAILAIIIAVAFYYAPVVQPVESLKIIKYLIYASLLGFVAYTVYCSSRENFYKSVKKIAQLKWGWQVGIDLYIGLLLQTIVVYLVTGSVSITLLWLLPTLVYGNIIPLLFFATHFDLIVGPFMR